MRNRRGNKIRCKFKLDRMGNLILDPRGEYADEVDPLYEEHTMFFQGTVGAPLSAGQLRHVNSEWVGNVWIHEDYIAMHYGII